MISSWDGAIFTSSCSDEGKLAVAVLLNPRRLSWSNDVDVGNDDGTEGDGVREGSVGGAGSVRSSIIGSAFAMNDSVLSGSSNRMNRCGSQNSISVDSDT